MDIQQRLAELAELGLQRSTRLVEGPQGPQVLLDGRTVTLLCSNNYLGLASHPRVREAAARAALELGAGSGASRLVSGTMSLHRELERELAEFEGTGACLLFGSGYLANIGAIGALAGKGDVIFSDALNHASIVDGCRLSRAETVIYRHLDVEHLEWCLADWGRDGHRGRDSRPSDSRPGRDGCQGRDRHRGRDGCALIVTDSVFSMDGDVAPLAEIVELARRHGARVLVDEAHATGALGPKGAGAVAAAGLAGEIDVVVGTLGKALGSYGAYVCGNEETIRLLLNVSRSLIFSTAPPPPAIAAAAAALELLRSDESLMRSLHAASFALRAGLYEQGFAVREGEMHIVPLVVHDERAAMGLCEAAIERGVFAQAIRPPTVPAGTSRLRLTAMAMHTPEQMHIAARALRDAALDVGLDPTGVGEPSHARAPAGHR